jgi:GNAT superfamily N-acetyltransferase
LAEESEGVKLEATVLQKGMLSMFSDASKGFYNVAEDEGEIVGCHMVTYEWSDWRNGWVYWLQSVYVRESHRNKGVFRIMYNNLTESIRTDPDVIGLRLYVDKSNSRAQQVYSAMGMNGEHYTVFEWMK